MGRKTIRPEAVVRLRLNGHRFVAERWPGRGWSVTCPSWPDIAEKYAGAADATPAIEEFTRRALGQGGAEAA